MLGRVWFLYVGYLVEAISPRRKGIHVLFIGTVPVPVTVQCVVFVRLERTDEARLHDLKAGGSLWMEIGPVPNEIGRGFRFNGNGC